MSSNCIPDNSLVPFVKMHGARNDYIFIDCRQLPVPPNLPELARRMSDRHAGIGGDGLILIHAAAQAADSTAAADGRMQMFNADGSEAEMCGNGLRCVAALIASDGGPVAAQSSASPFPRELKIDSARGRHSAVVLERSNRGVFQVRLRMGRPILDPDQIVTSLRPVKAASGLRLPMGELEVEGVCYPVAAVSMGNPHCVIFQQAYGDREILQHAARISRHAAFAAGANVEFVSVVDRARIDVRVWERGTGETQACGTGACAAVVAGILQDRLDQRVEVRLPGGTLLVEWNDPSAEVVLEGPAEEVFRGLWPWQKDLQQPAETAINPPLSHTS